MDKLEAIIEEYMHWLPHALQRLRCVGFNRLGVACPEHTGKVSDDGVDATGQLNAYNMPKINVFVQARRYKRSAKISTNTVRALRANIPSGGQGVLITTADYRNKARAIALGAGFPGIGLINRERLADISAEDWHDIPEGFRIKLDLKVGSL